MWEKHDKKHDSTDDKPDKQESEHVKPGGKQTDKPRRKQINEKLPEYGYRNGSNYPGNQYD